MIAGVEPLDRATKARLELIAGADWHFADAKTQTGVHGIHPYPAKFIPQIPRQLIEFLADGPDVRVFDPFCGSGTTLVEAQAAGHPSIGVDLNPIATLIAGAKTRLDSTSISTLAADICRAAKATPVRAPEIPRVDHWFAPAVKDALSALCYQIANVSDDAVRDDLRLALSSIIVRVSYQDGDTRYAAVPKQVSAELVFELFERAAADLDSARQAHFGSLFGREFAPVRVITKDILAVEPEEIGEIDLVVTSPPYPNAYEYWLYHKYRMYWLGFDPISVREVEIGARPHFFKKNHHTADDFERQMAGVFRLLDRTLRPSGIACFVVADSLIHGRIVDNVALLQHAAAASGFSPLAIVQRNVPNTRKAFNPANARTSAESIAVFGRS